VEIINAAHLFIMSPFILLINYLQVRHC